MDDKVEGKSLGILQDRSSFNQNSLLKRRRASVFEEVQLSQEELLKVSSVEHLEDDQQKPQNNFSDGEYVSKSSEFTCFATKCSLDLVPAQVELVPVPSGPSSASTTRPQTPDYSHFKQDHLSLKNNLFSASFMHHSAVDLGSSQATSAVKSNAFAPDFSFDSPNKLPNQLPWQTDILLSGAAARSCTNSSANVTANPSPDVYSRSTGATPSSAHHHAMNCLIDPMANETIASVTQRDAFENSLRLASHQNEFESKTIPSVTFGESSFEQGHKMSMIPNLSRHSSKNSTSSFHHSNLASIQPFLDAPPPLAPPTAIGIEHHSATNSGHSSTIHSPNALPSSVFSSNTETASSFDLSNNRTTIDAHSSFFPPLRYPHDSSAAAASNIFFGSVNVSTLSADPSNQSDQKSQQHNYSSSAPANLTFFSYPHSSDPLDSTKHSTVPQKSSFSPPAILLPGASAHNTDSKHDQFMDVTEVRISDLEKLELPPVTASEDFHMTRVDDPSLTKDFDFNPDEDLIISDHTYNVAVAAAFQFGQAFNQQQSTTSDYMHPSGSGNFTAGSISLYKSDDGDSTSLYRSQQEEAAMSSFTASRYEGLYTGDQHPLNVQPFHSESNNVNNGHLSHQHEPPLEPKKKKSKGKKSLVPIDVVNKFHDNGSPKKKRAQVKTACAHCRKSSKKCSEHRPCDRCVHNNLECVDIARVSKNRKEDAGFNDIPRSGSKPPTAPKRKNPKHSPNVHTQAPENTEGIMEWISTAVEAIAPAPKKRGRKKKQAHGDTCQNEEHDCHAHGDCDDHFRQLDNNSSQPFQDSDPSHPFASYSHSDYGYPSASLYDQPHSSSFPDSLGINNINIHSFQNTDPVSQPHYSDYQNRRSSFAYPTATVASNDPHSTKVSQS